MSTSMFQIKQLRHARLLELLDYDAESGVFRWKKKTGRSPRGARAGVIGVRGYRCIKIDGKDYRAGRLAWFYVHAAWPIHLIDHIDGDRANDALSNLRQATHAQNNANAKGRNRKYKGFPRGAHFHKASGKWTSNIQVRGELKYLGLFQSPELAAAAYRAAAFLFHKEFARLS